MSLLIHAFFSINTAGIFLEICKQIKKKNQQIKHEGQKYKKKKKKEKKKLGMS